jgi:hypothetical protein
VKCCVAPILHPLTITSSPNRHNFPLDHYRAVRVTAMGINGIRLFSMFASLGLEEPSITTCLSRMLQIDHRPIRDYF